MATETDEFEEGVKEEKVGDAVSPTVYDDLTDTSSNDPDLLGGAQAKIAEMEELLMAKDSEISKLKSHNYELLMSSGSGTPAESVDGGEDDDDDDFEFTIDDLFEDKE